MSLQFPAQPFCLLIAFKRTSRQSQKPFQALGLCPGQHSSSSPTSADPVTMREGSLTGLWFFKDPLLCFPGTYGLHPPVSHLLTSKAILNVMRLNQISGRQHNAWFRASASASKPGMQTPALPFTGHVTWLSAHLLICKMG